MRDADEPRSGRILAFDRLRGVVMVLMTVDHAMHVFTSHQVANDSAYLGDATDSLTPDGTPWGFLSRWVSHLCAPVFLFLVGAALAQSVARRRARGAGEVEIDGHLLRRGLLLVLAEVWMSYAWGVPAMQVMWAIGGTLVALVALRRLPPWGAGLLGAAWILGGEAVVGWLGLGPDVNVYNRGARGVVEGLLLAPRLFVPGNFSQPIDLLGPEPIGLVPMVVIHYPLLSWLSIALLGWWFGSAFARRAGDRGRRDAMGFGARVAAAAGLCLLVVFALQRVVNGYGNFWIERLDDHWLRWLQVSKYPPSVAFVGLELGLGLLLLAGLLRWEARGVGRATRPGWVALLGTTALFYYLVHAHLLQLGRWLLARVDPAFAAPNLLSRPALPLEAGWIAAGVTVLLMVPLCALWRRLRVRGAGGARPR